jgi:hypothetical protein
LATVSDLFGLPDGPEGFFGKIFGGIPFFYRNDAFGLLCVLWHAVSATWQFQMVYQQIKNMMDNLTYNETVNLKNYKYFWRPDNRFWNPFDRGTKLANVMEFFNPTIDWKKLYRIHDAPV